MNNRQKGGDKTYRMPGREGRAAQHLFDLAVSDLCNAQAQQQQQQKRSANSSQLYSTKPGEGLLARLGSAAPGHQGLDWLMELPFKLSFDATGSVWASRRRRRTPRTRTFISLSEDR